MFKNNKKTYSFIFAGISFVFVLLTILNISEGGNSFKKEKTPDLIKDAEVANLINENVEQKLIIEISPKNADLEEQKNEYNSSGKIFIQDKEIEIKFNEGEKLIDVMNRLQNSRQINFSGKEFAEMGFLVQEINGIKQNPKENLYWLYYINGNSANIGISNYQLKNNDSIRWKLEAYE